MKYYGNGCTKYKVLGTFSLSDIMDPECPIGYIKEKGLLLDFVVNKDWSYSDCPNTKSYLAVRKFIIDNLNDIEEIEKVKYNNKEYLVGRYTKGLGDEIWILKELSKFSDDTYFKWRENTKHGTTEAKITDGNFEFWCVAKQDGDAIIDVKFCKCENKHRNKVTIERIEVQNASNEDIMDAIKQWKKQMRKELSA